MGMLGRASGRCFCSFTTTKALPWSFQEMGISNKFPWYRSVIDSMRKKTNTIGEQTEEKMAIKGKNKAMESDWNW